MKSFIAAALMPLVLLGIQKVNLIRNGGFEKVDDNWRIEFVSSQYPNTAQASIHDSSECSGGDFSASAETRNPPPWQQFNTGCSAFLRQDLLSSKGISDLDTVRWFQKIQVVNSNPDLGEVCFVGLHYIEPLAGKQGFCYSFTNPAYTFLDNWHTMITHFDSDDTSWTGYSRYSPDDIEAKVWDTSVRFDQITLVAHGWWLPGWRGEKVYWDDLQVMGWADYDVAVTRNIGTLSAPSAIIWNNGREDQDQVKVVAVIEDSNSVVYSDTVKLALASDDSTEVRFDTWDPDPSTDYVLSIKTGNLAGMDADECDEDDVLTKEYTGVEEVTHGIANPWKVEKGIGSNLVLQGISNSEPLGFSVLDVSGRKVADVWLPPLGKLTWGENQPDGVYYLVSGIGELFSVERFILIR